MILWLALSGVGIVAVTALVVALARRPACLHQWEEVARDKPRRYTRWDGPVGTSGVLASGVQTWVMLRCRRCGDVRSEPLDGAFE